MEQGSEQPDQGPCSLQWIWTRWSLRVPSNSNNYMILGRKGQGCTLWGWFGWSKTPSQCVLVEWRWLASIVTVTWALCLRPFMSQHALVPVVAKEFCGSSNHSFWTREWHTGLPVCRQTGATSHLMKPSTVALCSLHLFEGSLKSQRVDSLYLL